MRLARTASLAVATATWLGCGGPPTPTATTAPATAPTPPRVGPVATPARPAVAPTPLPPAVPLPAGERPSFLVIAPDTLRGDRVGATRNGAPVMPNVDALAARGASFSSMYSQSGWTLPALASFLSGRYPLVGTQRDGNPAGYLRANLATLPERFAAAGYDTAVFWGLGISDAAPEFSRGFTHVGRTVGASYESDVLDWLTTRDHRGTEARPFFALVHNVDLQFPLAPAPGDPLLATVHPAADQGMEPVLSQLAATAGRDAAGASVTAAYDAMVTRYDTAIGRMVAGLDAAGLADHTVIVVTSNHGIELGERGSFFHGTVADTNLHVPLVVVDPAAPQKGQRIDTLVQTIDLAPTLLQRAGLTTGSELVGQSLLPLLGLDAGTGGTYTEHEVYSFNSVNLVSLRTRTHKVVRMDDPRGGGVRTQLFDLAFDPSERTDYRGPPLPSTQDLATKLEAWLAERVAETAAAPTAADLEQLELVLQREGYWDVATGETTQGTGGKGDAGGKAGGAAGTAAKPKR